MKSILALSKAAVDAVTPRYFWLFSLLLANAGCASTSSGIRERFARERGCPEAQVAVREKGGTVYAASGCGASAEYTCPSFTSGKNDVRACEERGLDRQAPALEERRSKDPRFEAPQ
jgi:hypothetical protein